MSFRRLSSAEGLRVFGQNTLVAKVDGRESFLNLSCYYTMKELGWSPYWYPIWTGEQEMPNSDWDVETDTAGILVRGDKVLYYGCIGHNVEVFNRESKTFYLELSENFWIKDGVLVAEDKDVAEDAMARERLKREFERDDADVEP